MQHEQPFKGVDDLLGPGQCKTDAQELKDELAPDLEMLPQAGVLGAGDVRLYAPGHAFAAGGVGGGVGLCAVLLAWPTGAGDGTLDVVVTTVALSHICARAGVIGNKEILCDFPW